MTEPRVSDRTLTAIEDGIIGGYFLDGEKSDLALDLRDARQRITELEAELSGTRVALESEYRGATSLRERLGARDDETFPAFVERLAARAAERDLLAGHCAALREALEEALAALPCTCDSDPDGGYRCPHRIAVDALASTESVAREYRERIANPIYAERNMLVGALSKLFPSWIGNDPKEPDWPVVYVQLPTGQASWHITKLERYSVFSHLNDGGAGCVWDGHDDVEKYRRVCTLEAGPAPMGSEDPEAGGSR